MPFLAPCHKAIDCNTVTMQSTARMQIPINIQLEKLKLQFMSALNAATGRFNKRPKCDSTKSVPIKAAPVAM